ncbi:MAG: LysR substrate-binding domain-containing protein [Candidatus Sulfotelmatobacter sp.]|jgi:DNA-binding transcriptional LysR family regulator
MGDQGHPGAHKESLVHQDLAQDPWILFSKQVHPLLRDAVLEAAQSEEIVPKDVHGILTAQEALYLVVQRVGVAILTKPTMTDTRAKKDVIVKPLADTALSFETCLVLRAHEESRFVDEFVRSYL